MADLTGPGMSHSWLDDLTHKQHERKREPMQLSQEDIRELLVALNLALLNATDDEQRELFRKWIHRLSQMVQ